MRPVCGFRFRGLFFGSELFCVLVVVAEVAAADDFSLVVVDSIVIEREGMVYIITTGGDGCCMPDTVDVVLHWGVVLVRLLLDY